MDFIRRYQQRPICRTARTAGIDIEAGSPGPIGSDPGGLIPIRKTAAWWNLTQEERRSIFEKKSHHIAEGVKYLPSIARQLYHGRDIGEPFDFLTWFEYAPEYSEAFEELVRTLRKTEE